jgi:hypothetical protein
MFPIPLASWAVRSSDGETKQKRLRLCFIPEFFPKLFWKSVDGDKAEVLAETLSLIGKLFEIYFVRLIGTPNQNSKNGVGFG